MLDIKCVVWRIMLQIEFGKSFQNIGKNFPSVKYVLIFYFWVVFIVLKPKESLGTWMQNVAIAEGRKLTGLGRWLRDKAPAVQTSIPMIPRAPREPDTVAHICDHICNLSASTKRWGKAAAGGCTSEWKTDPSSKKAAGSYQHLRFSSDRHCVACGTPHPLPEMEEREREGGRKVFLKEGKLCVSGKLSNLKYSHLPLIISFLSTDSLLCHHFLPSPQPSADGHPIQDQQQPPWGFSGFRYFCLHQII